MFEGTKIKGKINDFSEVIIKTIKDNVQDEEMISFVLKTLSKISIKTVQFDGTNYNIAGTVKKGENVAFSLKFLPSIENVSDIEVEYITEKYVYNFTSKKEDKTSTVEYRRDSLEDAKSFAHSKKIYDDKVLSYVLKEVKDQDAFKYRMREVYIVGNIVESKKIGILTDGTESIAYSRKEIEKNKTSKNIEKELKAKDFVASSEGNFTRFAEYYKNRKVTKEPKIFQKTPAGE